MLGILFGRRHTDNRNIVLTNAVNEPDVVPPVYEEVNQAKKGFSVETTGNVAYGDLSDLCNNLAYQSVQ